MIDLKIVDDRLTSPPSYATEGSAGMDLQALLDEPLKLYPDETYVVHTGIALDMRDPGLVGLVVPRSGLSTKYGVSLANSIGVIDSDYQGEIKLALKNTGPAVYTVKPGDRVAQLLIMPVFQPMVRVVDEFASCTERGVGGFGSTGVGASVTTAIPSGVGHA